MVMLAWYVESPQKTHPIDFEWLIAIYEPGATKKTIGVRSKMP